MASRPDHISIRRQSPAERPASDDQQSPGGQQRPGKITKDDKERVRRGKIAAVLLGLLAVMLLIAMLTYTSRDEANAQLTIRDVMGVIRGDDALRVRFDTTYNWLGLLGAVLANWFYIATIGVWSICIPSLMFLWSRDIYTIQKLSPRTTRLSVVTISVAVLVASLVGTLQQMSWFTGIDRIWSGAIGQYLSSIVVHLIGVFGSTLIHLAGLSVLVILGYGINTTRLSVISRLAGSKFKNSLSRIGGSSDEDHEASDPTTDDFDPDVRADGQPSPVTVNSPTGSVVSSVSSVADRIVRPFLATRERPVDPPIEIPNDDTPQQATLPPVSQPVIHAPIDLAPGVRILRSTKTRLPEVPPADIPASPVAHTDDEFEDDVHQNPVDMNLVQQRLQALHPNRDLNIRKDAGPTEPGDSPELPLFLQEDEEEEDELPPVFQTRPPSSIAINRPLTVTVEEGSGQEPEIPIQNATLYDEHISYKTPSGSLLVDTKEDNGITDEELQENARLLQEKLETFRIKIENLTVQPGPVITQYEFVPAAGIKLSQIESLSDDIALALKAQGVRIIAPIPGRGTVGIEIPNNNPAVVRFSTIVKSPRYHNPDIKLPIAMGKTVGGEVYCADLTKMPHLLIAGATGKGKSVGINTIIASLLYKMHPRDLKFVIIDPKRVEMTLYAALKNHFLAMCPDVSETIITEPQNAVTVLKSVVEEMQQRYSILAAAGQRNIADYNRKAKEGVLKNKGGIDHRPMPYIVVIIDELADLMMTAGKEVEDPIVRLAQLARAVGIHCIVATQRPSVDVVTGLIKANFPARIAYQVASRIDSRTILDASGAEHLIGNGDMLFNPGTLTKPLRMQNAFISTEEVEAICEWIGKQKGYSTPYALPSVMSKRSGYGSGNSDDRDVLFEDAARTFIQLQQASVSTLQRRLKIGYARAARIVDELEMAGIVGPPDGSKGRQVLLQSESELEAYL